MGRLTEYTGHGYVAYDPIDTKYDFSEINLQKLIDKLAHYEDLEEQGRLVVLPEEFDRERVADIILEQYCPSYFGIEDLETCIEFSEEGRQKCKECWEAALKGVE